MIRVSKETGLVIRDCGMWGCIKCLNKEIKAELKKKADVRKTIQGEEEKIVTNRTNKKQKIEI